MTGPDGISPRLLREAELAIALSLTRSVSMSLQKSQVQKQWKRANVTPIFKHGIKDLLNNYRPTSLLSLPSKILERVVFKQVYNYLHKNKLLTKYQSGFRPNDSTIS